MILFINSSFGSVPLILNQSMFNELLKKKKK